MAAPPPSPGSGADGEATPRWVKVFGLVALLVVVIFVIVHLAGGGFRGHAMHGAGAEKVEPAP